MQYMVFDREHNPDKCDGCSGKIKSYEESFDEHVVEDIEVIRWQRYLKMVLT
jgi:hypothetical protein